MSTTAVAAYTPKPPRLLQDASSARQRPCDNYRCATFTGEWPRLAPMRETLSWGKSVGVVSDPRSARSCDCSIAILCRQGQPGLDLSRASAVQCLDVNPWPPPNDPIHPVSFAEALAGAIPHASLVKLAPKEVNDAPHIEEVNFTNRSVSRFSTSAK